MSITYKYVITKLEVDTQNPELVTYIDGYRHGIDNETGKNFTVTFGVFLETDDPNNIIPYDDLTETTVETWLDAVITDKERQKLDLQIAQQIEEFNSNNEVKTPGHQTIRNLPW